MKTAVKGVLLFNNQEKTSAAVMGVGGQQRGTIGGTTVKCYETSTRMGDWMVPTCFFLSI